MWSALTESLGRPEHDDGEEIGAGDECDDQSESKNSRCLLESRGEHRMLCSVDFPETKRY